MKFRPETTTSERQLALALAASGRNASLDELSAWRKDGLLPPMASTGLGVGRGKSYYWREENILQRAQAACDAMRRHGRTDHALICLFLAGFAVPPAQLRRAWLHRARMRNPPAVRIVRNKLGAGAVVDLCADNLLLQAALCVGAAVETDDKPLHIAIMALLNRALSKLGLARHGANDSGLADQLCHLLTIIGSVLEASDLVRETSDDELQIAQRHLGVATEFLIGCSDASEILTEKLGSLLFLYFLTLLRSGQSDMLDRMMGYMSGATWLAPVVPARSLSQNGQA